MTCRRNPSSWSFRLTCLTKEALSGGHFFELEGLDPRVLQMISSISRGLICVERVQSTFVSRMAPRHLVEDHRRNSTCSERDTCVRFTVSERSDRMMVHDFWGMQVDLDAWSCLSAHFCHVRSTTGLMILLASYHYSRDTLLLSHVQKSHQA